MARRRKSLRQAALQIDDPYGYVKDPTRAKAAAAAKSAGASGSGVPANVARTAEGFVIPGVGLDALGRPTGGPTLPDSTGGGRVDAEAAVAAEGVLSGSTVQKVQDEGLFDKALGVGTTIKDTGVHWLSELFNTEDESDLNIAGVPLGGVEATWDGFLKGMGWVYDRISQTGAYGQSVLPGGLDTLTWEQAGDISWGQAAVTDVAMRDDQMSGSLLGQIVSKPVNTLAGGVIGGGLGLIANAGDMAPYTRPGFDITDSEQRKAAFVESEVGKWTTGLTDAAIAIVADPLILGGKALKISKVRYLDRLIRTQDDIVRVGQELDYGKTVLGRNATSVDDAGAVVSRQVEQITREEARELAMAPIARFAHDVVERVYKEDGTWTKRLSDTEIYNHRVIRTATNRDALTAALYNARTYDEASMILRHAAGDVRASREMLELAPDLYRHVLDGERRLITEMVRTNPSAVAAEIAKWEARHDVLLKRLDDMKAVGADEAAIARVREEADDVARMWQDATNAQFNPVGTGPKATQEELDLLRRSIDKELEGNELFYASLTSARESASSTWNAFGKATSGFTKGRIDDSTTLTSKMSDEIGKIIHESRARRSTKTSRAQMGKGFEESVQGGWVAQTFYGINKFNPVARVLRWSGVERPSGLVYTSGIGAQESAREIRGLMNSIDIYSGAGRVVQRGGKDVLIGGVQNKERVIQAWQNAMLKGGDEAQFDAKKLLDDLEEQLLNDIADWHGLDRELLKGVHYHQNRQLEKIAKEIIEEGYWFENGTKNYAPYLETQLLTQRFMKNWRKIDQIAGRVAKRERKRRGVVVDVETGRYTDSGILANTANNFNMINSAFQDFWRPAVLLRLGYTQRNVMEGMFRSMAFQWSLAPAGYALQNLGYGFGNIARKKGMSAGVKASEKARAAAKSGLSWEQMPARFQKWRNSQLDAIKIEVGNTQEAITYSRGVLARENAAYRAARIEKLERENARILAYNAQARATQPMTRDMANAVAHNEDRLTRIYDELADIRTLQGGAPDLDDTARAMMENLDYLEDVQQPFNLMVWDSLDDPLQATNMYRRSTLQHRRVFGKTRDASDRQTMQAIMSGKAFDEAFDPASEYAQIALQNLSADHTMRATAAMRMQAVADALNLQETRYYVEVKPGDPEYFDGVATVLNQFQNSDIGQIIIKGRATGMGTDQIVDEVARFLYTTKQGDVVGRFIAGANDFMFGGRFEGVNARVARGAQAAREAAEPLDVAVKQARQFRTEVMREVRRAERDLAKRQAASNRPLKRYVWADGSYKTRAQLDKMLADADAGVAAAQKEYDDFLRAFPEPEPKDAGRYDLTELEDAREYVEEVLRRYDIVTAKNQGLQEYLYSNRQLPIGKDFKDTTSGDIVKSFLTDANGKDLPDLQPVIGHMASMVGEKNWLEMFNAVTAKGFKILGTIPEDAMVRAPMYGKRYAEAVKESYAKVIAQVGEDGLTMRHVNMIREQAHRRALKDTKDWLYTIDRRTNLGSVMENWIPFISATQNAVTTIGRIVWNDPAVLGVMRLIWTAPDKMFEDGDGNPDTFAVPIGWADYVPGLAQIKDALRLDDKLQFNKRSADLLFNGVMDPQLNGLFKIPSSEAMKNGMFGLYTPDTPDWLRFLDASEGDGTADWVWDRWKALNFGEGFGASQMPTSVDLALSGWQRNALDAIFTDSLGSASIARSFSMIRMQENLKKQAGLRPDDPTFEEVRDQTRAFSIARMLGSLAFAFQPQYENNVEVAVEAVYKIDTAHREYLNQYNALVAAGRQAEADALPVVAPAEAVFGAEVVEALGVRSRTNNAGAPSSTAAVDRARENTELIRKLAPDLETSGNLDSLGLLFTDVDDLYDPNAQAWMVSNTIPGTDEEFRSVENPEQSYRDARIAAGWQRWMRGKEALELDMANKGISWASMSEREEYLYKQQKDALRDAITADYPEWRTAFDDQGGLRAQSAIKVIEGRLSDPVSQERDKDDPVWQQGGIANQYVVARQQYIDGRRALLDDMKSKGMFSRQSKQATLYNEAFTQLDEWWKGQQAIFRAASPTWVGVQDRWIGEDEQPTPAGGYGMDEEAA